MPVAEMFLYVLNTRDARAYMPTLLALNRLVESKTCESRYDISGRLNVAIILCKFCSSGFRFVLDSLACGREQLFAVGRRAKVGDDAA